MVGSLSKKSTATVVTSPLTTVFVEHVPECVGHRWLVSNEDVLARLVAQVMLGQYKNAEAILHKLEPQLVKVPQGALQQAISALTLPPGTGDEAARWHRDGLVFQHISWVAAITEHGKRLAIAPPHARPANKGFDSLFVLLKDTGDAEEMIVICEDKATINARKMITGKVLPEIKAIERGERDAELTSELTTLLSMYAVTNSKAILESGIWAERKQYRISITIHKSEDSDGARKAIFKGYDKVANQMHVVRRSGTFAQDDIRQWMEQFCLKVITHCHTIAGEPNV